tara:strand:+ start:348 stop:566 length:219 start_codon:yes stop_codon:yes gene_type:complete
MQKDEKPKAIVDWFEWDEGDVDWFVFPAKWQIDEIALEELGIESGAWVADTSKHPLDVFNTEQEAKDFVSNL